MKDSNTKKHIFCEKEKNSPIQAKDILLEGGQENPQGAKVFSGMTGSL